MGAWNRSSPQALAEMPAANVYRFGRSASRKNVKTPQRGVFHLPECSGVATMSESNRRDYTGSRQALLDQGYSPCGTCNP